MDSFYGLKIIESRQLPYKDHWIFPKDRFVEWGPEDESYCRFAGFGRIHRVYETFRGVNSLLIHPDTLAQLKKETAARNDLPRTYLPPSITNYSV
jgi:hypothetical protein